MAARRLHATGIGQRWLQVLDRKQKNTVGESQIILSADDRGRGIGRRVGRAGRVISSSTISWVCPICRTIVKNDDGTQQMCITVSCSGVKPVQRKTLPTVNTVEGDRPTDVAGKDKDAAIERLFGEIFPGGIMDTRGTGSGGDERPRTSETGYAAGGCARSRWSVFCFWLVGGVLTTVMAPRSHTQYTRVQTVDIGTTVSGVISPVEDAPVSVWVALMSPDQTERKIVGEMEVEMQGGVEEMEEEMDEEMGEEMEEEMEGGVTTVIEMAKRHEDAVRPNTPRQPKAPSAWARVEAWREKHKVEAVDFLTGPWC